MKFAKSIWRIRPAPLNIPCARLDQPLAERGKMHAALPDTRADARLKTKSPGTKAEACDAVRVHPANQSSCGRLATDFERMMTGIGADKMSRKIGTDHPITSRR
jgi:hypothetical protein